MHASLTDAVTCPKCGPAWGMILMADRVENRRILEGWFACPNCHARFRVSAGYAELRTDESSAPSDSAVRVEHVAALLGITQGPANVLLAGSAGQVAEQLGELVEGIEVVTTDPALGNAAERNGVSRFGTSRGLPFRDGCMRGVVLGADAIDLVEEAARIAGPRARVVLLSGDATLADRVQSAGLHIIARDNSAIVALR